MWKLSKMRLTISSDSNDRRTGSNAASNFWNDFSKTMQGF